MKRKSRWASTGHGTGMTMPRVVSKATRRHHGLKLNPVELRATMAQVYTYDRWFVPMAKDLSRQVPTPELCERFLDSAAKIVANGRKRKNPGRIHAFVKHCTERWLLEGPPALIETEAHQ